MALRRRAVVQNIRAPIKVLILINLKKEKKPKRAILDSIYPVVNNKIKCIRI